MGPYGFQSPPTASFFGPVYLPRLALAGVRKRRFLAFCLDFALVSVIAAVLHVVCAVLTVGLSLLVFPSFWPLVAFFYNGLSITGRSGATPGMRLFDLEMRAFDGSRVTFLMAGVHAVMLYLSWLFPPVFLVSLFTADKRCLHDIFAGVIVVRRPL
jgi:uncharacterized RDD family membrane protein YckC